MGGRQRLLHRQGRRGLVQQVLHLPVTNAGGDGFTFAIQNVTGTPGVVGAYGARTPRITLTDTTNGAAASQSCAVNIPAADFAPKFGPRGNWLGWVTAYFSPACRFREFRGKAPAAVGSSTAYVGFTRGRCTCHSHVACGRSGQFPEALFMSPIGGMNFPGRP